LRGAQEQLVPVPLPLPLPLLLTYFKFCSHFSCKYTSEELVVCHTRSYYYPFYISDFIHPIRNY
jgi:hypothetical protein